MFKSICPESVFPMVVMMILCLPSASHSNPCIRFGVPENYAMPVEGCDSVASGECQYAPPFVCTDANPSYTWEIIRPADPSLGKGGSIDQTGKLTVDGASCGTITVKVTGSCGLSAEKKVRMGTADGENPTSALLDIQYFGCGTDICWNLGSHKCYVDDSVIGFNWTFQNATECLECPHLGWPCPDFQVTNGSRKNYKMWIARWGCKE
ncbi:MAG TPA: hypothetical protein PK250_08360 [Syntrophobacter fumaroxidans]|nr:hypothetical protein [Syntrophobacter fumaroxidans]